MNTLPLKIKLAAIARDEALYLPEWIFHHLDFGFDEIEIYINNSSDNSLAILSNIAKNHPVVVTDANRLYKSSSNNFQLLAYQTMAEKAIKDGFSHILFLDIDEFWTPADFKSTIKQALSLFDYPQALSLNWLLHCDETDFSPCYKHQLKVQPNSHVKTIFRLDNSWDKIEIHNIVGKNVLYTRGDGNPYDFGESPHCGITDNKCMGHKFFIIHRMYRSQLEYISLLGRGRANKLKLKDNRNGYYSLDVKYEIICIDRLLLDSYNKRFDAFLNSCELKSLLKESLSFVLNRYKEVINWALKSNSKEATVFYKLFDRIELPEVIRLRKSLYHKMELSSLDLIALSTPRNSYLLLLVLAKLLHKFGFTCVARYLFLHIDKIKPKLNASKIITSVEVALKNVQYPANKHADIYREIAIQLHKSNELDTACDFITKAKKHRPNGPYILKLYDDFMKENNAKN